MHRSLERGRPSEAGRTHLGEERVLVDLLVDQGRADEADEAPRGGAGEAQDRLHWGRERQEGVSARGLLEDLGWSWPQTREQAEPALSPGHSDCAGSAAGWEHKAAPSRCGVCASVSSLTRLQPSLGTARQL